MAVWSTIHMPKYPLTFVHLYHTQTRTHRLPLFHLPPPPARTFPPPEPKSLMPMLTMSRLLGFRHFFLSFFNVATVQSFHSFSMQLSFEFAMSLSLYAQNGTRAAASSELCFLSLKQRPRSPESPGATFPSSLSQGSGAN